MAIDTRAKRFSMMTFGDIWQPSIPTPSGSFDQGDRQHLLHGYSGIVWELVILLIKEVSRTSNISTGKEIDSTISTGKEISSTITPVIEMEADL